MAFFMAAGVISNDIVRKETRKGVLTSFRLETGAPLGGKLWIDIECRGHLAGTVARHGTKGRGVAVSGRLTQKTWRDRETGEARSRYVVTALDVDLLPDFWIGEDPYLSNRVLLTATVNVVDPRREAGDGVVTSVIVSSGRASSKNGRVQLYVEHWRPKSDPSPVVEASDSLVASGGLAHRRTDRAHLHGLALVAREFATIHRGAYAPTGSSSAPPKKMSSTRSTTV